MSWVRADMQAGRQVGGRMGKQGKRGGDFQRDGGGSRRGRTAAQHSTTPPDRANGLESGQVAR